MRIAVMLVSPMLVLGGPALAQQDHAHAEGKAAGPSTEMHQMMMKGSKQSMQMKPSGDMDRDFARMMRHHHQMGVRMAEQEMKNGKDPKMKELASKIAASQKDEIKQFDDWLKSSGNTKNVGSRVPLVIGSCAMGSSAPALVAL